MKEVGVSKVKGMVPLYSLHAVSLKDATKKRYQLQAGFTMYLD